MHPVVGRVTKPFCFLKANVLCIYKYYRLKLNFVIMLFTAGDLEGAGIDVCSLYQVQCTSDQPGSEAAD